MGIATGPGAGIGGGGAAGIALAIGVGLGVGSSTGRRLLIRNKLSEGWVPSGTALLPFEPTSQTMEMQNVTTSQLFWTCSLASTFTYMNHLLSTNDTCSISSRI